MPRDLSRPKRRNAITTQFAPRPIPMLESPAYRVLSRAAHQVLARIEIEHARHGGTDNGKLPVTYNDFEVYGIHRRQIAPAIRELEALGFIEITERGCAGNADFRRPSKYRLTYRNAQGEGGDGTHEWRRAPQPIEDAKALVNRARQGADPYKIAAGKKRNPSGRERLPSVAPTTTDQPKSSVAETTTTVRP